MGMYGWGRNSKHLHAFLAVGLRLVGCSSQESDGIRRKTRGRGLRRWRVGDGNNGVPGLDA